MGKLDAPSDGLLIKLVQPSYFGTHPMERDQGVGQHHLQRDTGPLRDTTPAIIEQRDQWEKIIKRVRVRSTE